MGGFNDFGPFLKTNGSFVVQNISNPPKTLFIFNYPIPFGMERDLLAIPGVAESDIRVSLLKGELNHKLRSLDIKVLTSDVDLLQFNDAQKTFLQNAGVVNGLEVNSGNLFWTPPTPIFCLANTYLHLAYKVFTTSVVSTAGVTRGSVSVSGYFMA